jgi:DNA-binding NtrC family response regulator
MARVLVIELDRSLRTFIAGILGDLGHEVAQGRGVSECRDWLRREVFDVLATDLMLDKKAGQLVADAKNLRILTLSGQAFSPQPDHKETQHRLQEKPFRFEDLQALASAIADYEASELLAA